jgi:hypothetical protein
MSSQIAAGHVVIVAMQHTQQSVKRTIVAVIKLLLTGRVKDRLPRQLASVLEKMSARIRPDGTLVTEGWQRCE